MTGVEQTGQSTPPAPGDADSGGRPAVSYERHGSAALVTIDRQERRNAVDGPTAAALHEAYLRFEADEDARVMVLTGAGGVAFCAGADLKATESFVPRLMSPEGPMGFTRLTPSKPTIAAIAGFCLAGGLELALWCDLRIAAEGSTLGYPERRWGVPLIDGGTQRLPRIVGLGRALDLILTGRLLGAEEALSMGLLTEVVAAGAHLERALSLAEGLARFPQRTMLADRRAAIGGLGMTLAEGLALEAAAGPEVFEDGARGAARFAAGEGRGGAGAGA
jgi:enoyl-CoA hydratase